VAPVDPCRVYGLTSRAKRQRKDEDNAAFIKRLTKYLPRVIEQAKGDIQACALVFDVPVQMIEDVVAANRKTIGKVLTKARALAKAELERNSELAAEARKELHREVHGAEVTDKRLRRKSWPRDEDQRRCDIHDALCVSLVENEGDIVETSECLNVPIHEINEMLEGDEALLAARDAGLRVKAVRAESRLFGQMDQGNMQAVKMALTNLHGDMWSERQQVDVRRVGFAPPEDREAEEVSVLELVKGEKKNA
jgi:hypothetical protein